MNYHAAAVVQRARQFMTVPYTRQASVAVSYPPPAIRQISWCICSWSVPRRRCIGLIAARPAFASWMIESWPTGIAWGPETGTDVTLPDDDFFTHYTSHGELELNTDNNTVYVFMDIYRCIQSDIRMGIGRMVPADLFGNRTYGDILWFVRYSFFFSCVPGNAESVLIDDSIYFCPFFRAAHGQREILIGGWKWNRQCAQWHFDDDVDCQI